jgi:kynurenine formamidase
MKRLIVPTLLLAGMAGLAPVASSSGNLGAQTPEAAAPKPATGKRVAAQGEVSHSAFQNGAVGRTPRTEYKPHPATQDPSRLVTSANLTAWGKELSNWGRWGKDDQKGTLNLITPQKTVEAAALVKDGRVVTLTSFLGLNKFKPAVDTWNDVPARWWPINFSAEGQVSANDAVAFGVHDGIVTHMTALCYYGGLRADPSRVPEYGPWGAVGPNYPHQNSVFYNGYNYWVDELGCKTLGIDKMGLAYTTRGVLYDLPLLKKVDWLDPTTPIFVEDLEDWEKFAGVKAGQGDVMIVRTGRYAERAKEGPWYYDRGGAGLHASVLPWLKARNLAVLAGDGLNDVQPSGVQGSPRPIHQISLVIMGMPLINNVYPEDAAKIAQELKRWEFQVSWKNFDIPGGSGSPWNAVAIF